jgi:hypothetical protein
MNLAFISALCLFYNTEFINYNCTFTTQVINPKYVTAKSPADDARFSTEVNIMRRLSHNNLFVRVFGSINNSGHVLQWCECGVRIAASGRASLGFDSDVSQPGDSRCKKVCIHKQNVWQLTESNTIVMGKATFCTTRFPLQAPDPPPLHPTSLPQSC